MGATPAQIAMVTADQPPNSSISAITTAVGMNPKQAAALQAQLAAASSPQEAMKIAQAHGLNPQQAAQVAKQVQQGGGLTNGNHVNGGLVNGSGPQSGVSPQKAAGNQGLAQKEPVGVAGSTLLALQQKVKMVLKTWQP